MAISLPAELLDRIEAERRATGESRSEFVRRAVDTLLRAQDEQQADEEYIEAYRKYPETPEEIADAEAIYKAGLEVWLENPWEEDAGDLRETG